MDNGNLIVKQTKSKGKRLFEAFELIISIIIILVSLSILAYLYLDEQYPVETKYYVNRYVYGLKEEETKIEKYNEYSRKTNYEYVQATDNFYPRNYKDLENIFYTFLDSGNTSFKFYCPLDYKNCEDEAYDMIHNSGIINDMGKFLHPFNDYTSVRLLRDKNERTLEFVIERKYTDEKIEAIKKKVDELYPILVNENDSNYNNIKRVHDYLANNVEYDNNMADNDESIYDSRTAYGALIEGHAVCTGYTEAMYLFLEKMGLRSMRVSTHEHVWNAVQLEDGKWYHIDATFGDAKYTNGQSFIKYAYFLVDTEELLNANYDDHNFNQEIYKELRVD